MVVTHEPALLNASVQAYRTTYSCKYVLNPMMMTTHHKRNEEALPAERPQFTERLEVVHLGLCGRQVLGAG